MKVPGYWMNETSGVLRPVIMRYLDGEDLDTSDVEIMKAYLRQWMEGGWKGEDAARLRAGIRRIATAADLRRWLDEAHDIGIDPL